MESEENERKLGLASRLFEEGRYVEAFHDYEELAQNGSVTAQTVVGWFYYMGHGVTQNRETARQWLERAAGSGSAVALFYLGGLHRGQKRYQEALKHLEGAAEQNYSPALYHLGIMYDEGEGVTVDKDRAQYYLTKAAGLGNLRAQKDIAMSLIMGERGVWRIPQGVVSLARVLVTAVRVGWKDPDSDRIRW